MKKCSGCTETKELSSFAKNAHRKDGLQTHCRECNSKSFKKYYSANHKKHREIAKVQSAAQRKRARQFVLEYLLTHPCVGCGNDDILVLEFDHTGVLPKLSNINDLLKGHSLQVIEAEIAKCEVRCRNCHARKTYERAGNVDWRSKALKEMLAKI